MLASCRRVRLRFRSALATAAASPVEASISTSDSDVDPESHGPADATLLRRRMRASAAEGNLAAALDALALLRPAPAGAHDYNALLHAYLRSGQAAAQHVAAAEHVAAVLCHMRSVGPAPNALTFNTAFNGLLRLGHLDASHAVLEEMWSRCGFVPSFTTVDRLIKKAVSGSNFELALKVFDLMLSLCYFPTLPIANAIVSILLKSGSAETAYEVFMVLVNMYNQICKSGCSNKVLTLFCNLKANL